MLLIKVTFTEQPRRVWLGPAGIWTGEIGGQRLQGTIVCANLFLKQTIVRLAREYGDKKRLFPTACPRSNVVSVLAEVLFTQELNASSVGVNVGSSDAVMAWSWLPEPLFRVGKTPVHLKI